MLLVFSSLVCAASANATVNTSFHFKPELIRINLFLMKLLTFPLAETMAPYIKASIFLYVLISSVTP